METRELKIEFGRDQEIGADTLLDLMKGEGKVLEIKKKRLNVDKILYTITFDKAYSVYEFGYKSASLWQYAFGKYK